MTKFTALTATNARPLTKTTFCLPKYYAPSVPKGGGAWATAGVWGRRRPPRPERRMGRLPQAHGAKGAAILCVCGALQRHSDWGELHVRLSAPNAR